MNEKVRKTNLEILRIISMILIIAHHYSVHGDFDLPIGLTMNKLIVQILSLGGKLGVNCFVLITGYFMVTSTFNIKKLMRLVLEVFFYSASIAIIFKVFGVAEFGFKEMIKSLLPITFGKYWFATTYIILYMFTPFINQYLNKISKMSHLKLLALSLFLWAIIPTFIPTDFQLSEVVWLMIMYITGAYIRLYSNKYLSNAKLNMAIACISYGLIILSVITFDFLGTKLHIFSTHATYFAEINKLPLVISSIALFLAFEELDLGYHKFINSVALSVFGVYLIHDNDLMRQLLWKQIFRNNEYINSPLLILHAISSIIVVFIVCTIIDQIRLNTIDKILWKYIDGKWDKVTMKVNKYKNKINNFLQN